jgi:adenine C2-methylase RlmN of 23S rRNA A2503 and tRNA A37
MKTKTILERNPFSAKLVKEWMYNKLVESIKKENNVPEDFKQYMLEEGISIESLIIFIEANPRNLFDLFDDYKIIIEIFLYPNNEFTCKIGNQATTNSWKERKDCEWSAIEAAFDILEDQLKKEDCNIINE